MKTKRSGEAKVASGEITSGSLSTTSFFLQENVDNSQLFQSISLVFLRQLSVLVFFFFFLSRNIEILLCFLLLAEYRMFELHNFKMKQDYCFTAGIAGFCDKVFVANQ